MLVFSEVVVTSHERKRDTMNGERLIGVEAIATIGKKTFRGVVSWYRENLGLYGFQLDEFGDHPRVLPLTRDEFKTVDEMRAQLLA
jgi:hypothetical protein